MRMIMAASLALIATSGCAAPNAIDGGDAISECDATAAQPLVGKQKSEALGIEAMKRTGAATIRWIAPGQPVSMDYRTDRLNVEVDEQERVIRFNCG